MKPAPVSEIYAVLLECLGVLRTRDGIDLDAALVQERANNAATALIGAFEIKRLPVDEETP